MSSKIMTHYSTHYSRAVARVRGWAPIMAQEAGVALLTGGTLGVLATKLKGGLDMGTHKVPMDAVAGLGAMGLSMFIPLRYRERDLLRNVSIAAIAVGTARKTEAYLGSKSSVHGELDDGTSDMGIDPIVSAARSL